MGVIFGHGQSLRMLAGKSFWTVLLDPVTAEVLGFMPLDSF
jgi:hypothetical protein